MMFNVQTYTMCTKLSVMVLLLTMVSSWLLPTSPYQRSNTIQSFSVIHPHTRIKAEPTSEDGDGAENSPFFGPEEEFECPEEEECEIDWDRMPGFGDDDSDQEKETTSTTSTTQTAPSLKAAAPVEKERKVVSSSAPGQPVQSQRVNLEMSWQIGECQVESSTCSEECTDCRGAGSQVCRFCHGKTFVKFGDDVRSCIICQETGVEPCHTCRGTGGISPWAKTLDKFHRNETNITP